MPLSPSLSPSPSPKTVPPESTAPASTSTPPQAIPATRPTLLKFADGQESGRRPSVQFLSHNTAGLPTGSPKATRIGGRRMSSPPPPPNFRPRVSFDTFDKPADFIEESSFSLSHKHKDYEYTKRSRTFLCGLDSNDYSEYALEWLIDELVDDGDEIVCLRVVEPDDKIAEEWAIERGRYRAEAEKMMLRIQNKNHENKAINLVLEFSLGKVNKVIDEMINLYEPAILVVGTRGRSLGGFQGLLPGSVSKYCLQHSPVPVIVVRPNSKRAKAKRKRKFDPSRLSYREMMAKSGGDGGHLIDFDPKSAMFFDSQPPSEDESPALADATSPERHPLRQVVTPPPYPAAGEGSLQVDAKTPELGTLESPSLSSESTDDDDDGGGVDASMPNDGTEEASVQQNSVSPKPDRRSVPTWEYSPEFAARTKTVNLLDTLAQLEKK